MPFANPICNFTRRRRAPIINVLSLRHSGTQGLRHALGAAILAVWCRWTHGAGPMGKAETRSRTHKRRSMHKGQKGGQKAPIRGQFRQETRKKSKKAPNSALPILTFRPSNPLGASARPGSASETGRIDPNSTQNRPPTYRCCAICVRQTPGGGQSETPAPANSTKASQAMSCHLASRPMAFSSG